MSPTELRSPEDDALVEREQTLPALAVLLSDAALADWLGAGASRVSVRRRRIRLTSGASCVLAADLTDTGGTRTVLVAGYAEDAGATLARAEATAAGAVLAHDPGRRMIAVDLHADRALPALAAVHDPEARAHVLGRALDRELEPEELGATTLSYHPHRRWVGALGGSPGRLLVRAYRPGAMAPVEDSLRALGRKGAPVPRVLGRRRGLGLLVTERLPGTAVGPDSPGPVLQHAGRALASLHRNRARRRLPDVDPRQRPASLRTLGCVATLLPDLAHDLGSVHDTARSRLEQLHAPRRPVALHGDCSLDQLVSGGGEVRFADLDHAHAGHAADDLGGVLADLVARAGRGGTERAMVTYETVLAGYAELRDPPDEDQVREWAAEHLLRRAAEPFRRCEPRWPDRVRELVALAAREAT